MKALQPCGTIAAYARHIKAHEDPDAECRAAWSAYQNKYRVNNPPSGEKKQLQRQRSSARSRALWRLRLENDQRFQELYAEELAEGGYK